MSENVTVQTPIGRISREWEELRRVERELVEVGGKDS